MSCKIFQTEIKEGDWGAPLSLAAREHLDLCAACRKTHDEQTTLRLLIGDLEKVSAPADFDARLRSRIAASERSEQKSFGGRLTFSPGMAAAALAAVFVLGSALVVRLDLGDKGVTIDPPAPATEMMTKHRIAAPTPAVGKSAASTGGLTVAGEAESNPAVSDQNATGHRRRTVAARAGAARLIAVTPVVEAAGGTRTMGLTGASVVTAGTSSAVAIPVSGGVEPVSLILRNERGESQKVSIKPVSFGAQELVGRFNSAARNAPTGREGVW